MNKNLTQSVYYVLSANVVGISLILYAYFQTDEQIFLFIAIAMVIATFGFLALINKLKNRIKDIEKEW